MTGQIILAPMEGVLDYYLRDLITSVNNYDYCVSEFIRVYGVVFPKRIFLREVPELAAGGLTKSGTPVWVQLLGSEPKVMADNAKVCASLGAKGIDLNFGCPSKFVHRSNGGAAMLKNPPLLGEVIKEVRDALPGEIPLSVKIRLGWEDPNEAETIVKECIANGANKIVIHARTKKDGYLPNTVKWENIAPLKELAQKHNITVVANGDIVSKETAQNCQLITKCNDLMVGRFAIAIPNLERVIRGEEQKLPHDKLGNLLLCYLDKLKGNLNEHYQKARTKQFFGYIRMAYPELGEVFKAICHQETISDIANILTKLAQGSLSPDKVYEGKSHLQNENAKS